MQTPPFLRNAKRLAPKAAAWLAALACLPALALDIANAPLFTNSASVVKPNIMFIMDDSLSMEREYLPDLRDNDVLGTSSYGHKSAHCNGLAYDPKQLYVVPVNADKSSRGAGSTSFLSLSTQFSGVTPKRNVGTIATVPTTVNTSMTVDITDASPQSNWFSTNVTDNQVTIYGDLDTFIVGNVTNWSTSTKKLTLTVRFAVTNGNAMTGARIVRAVPTNNAYYTYKGGTTAMAYVYNSDGSVNKNADAGFYNECDRTASTNGDAQWQPVYASNKLSTAKDAPVGLTDAQNYANWYAHYKNRLLAMKAGVSLAFKDIDDSFRVGLTTLNPTITEGSHFLNVRDFELGTAASPKQKDNFYSKLWAIESPSNYTQSTPLRGALAKVGQYFAKKAAANQSYDPVQYSCQRNYTILSTDGYWNTYNENSSYGPFQLDRSTPVGQQDGGDTGTERPMFDGGSLKKTTVETWTRTQVITMQVDMPQRTTSTMTTRNRTQTVTGMQRYTYGTVENFNPSSMSFVPSGSNSIVTVNSSGPHFLVTGDRVNISGGSNSTFRSGNSSSTVTVTVIDEDTFTYTIPDSTPGAIGTASNYKVDPRGTAGSASALTCNDGQGRVRRYTQTQDRVDNWTTSVTATTTTMSTRTFTRTETWTFPNSRTITTVNGVTTIGPTTEGSGTLVSQQNSGSTVTATGTPVVTNGTPQSANDNTPSYTGWVTTSAPTSIYDSGNCYNSVPNGATPQQSDLAAPTTGTTPAAPVPLSPVNVAPTTRDVTPAKTATLTDSSSTGTVVKTPKPDERSNEQPNTLADVAMYYYKTDLRNGTLNNCDGAKGLDVCEDNVKARPDTQAHSFGDTATHQHLTTFTVGLGVAGQMKYSKDYFDDADSDFAKILDGKMNWPAPKAESISSPPSNVDDLWHAAVNGRGQYFSADNPTSLTEGLIGALNKMEATPGSAAAASTSSLQPVAGDNDIFVARFTTVEWSGDVWKYQINPNTGQIDSSPQWKAQEVLDGQAAGSRKIMFRDKDKSSTLLDFNWTNLSANGYTNDFQGFCSKTSVSGAGVPKQCVDFAADTARVAAANSGENLVNYLRGQQDLTSYYRKREHVLGDIINASPLFVGKPNFRYNDASYAQYATDKAGRKAVLLAAANDGMLHAFDRVDGSEHWAFVPSFVMKNMYKLADANYTDYHQYYVDGSPQIADIQMKGGTHDGKWRTIVVGGLNKGGRGYYALDVTDTMDPKFLWEFEHANLGLTYGNPIITKRSNGDWVVVFGSGYNNGTQTDGSPSGDGNGYLFVLDATSGKPVTDFPDGVPTYAGGTTAVGTPGDPSGLSEINVWVDSELDNTSVRFYGGDLKGNVWRFDLDGNVEPKKKALRLAQLTTPAEASPSLPVAPAPITTRPVLAEVDYNGSKFPVVYVATGQYLTETDIADKHRQSLYAIKDPLKDEPVGVVRGDPDFVVQTLTIPNGDIKKRESSKEKVDWINKQGWYVDFPLQGERVSVNPQIALDTIFVGTNLPNDSACASGGESFLYEFNFTTGFSTTTYLGAVLVQGLTMVQLPDGDQKDSIVTIITRSDGTVDEKVTNPGTSGGTLRRSSWRELVD